MTQLHIRARSGDVAPAVLLPGDPDRATFIAENYLEDVTRYNAYRHLYGYSGHYRGMRVSVQATGMGCPSLAIVVEELIRLGATTLVRVGTAGLVSRELTPGDLVIATGSVPNEGTSRHYLGSLPTAPVASFAVTGALADAAARIPRRTHLGVIQTDDGFYATRAEDVSTLSARGILAVEMEASALFTLAQLRGVRSGCLLVASNYIGDAAFAPVETLRSGVADMAGVALEAVYALES